jgi:hypothetical protein
VRAAIQVLATEDMDTEAAGILLLQDIKDIFAQHGIEEEESHAQVLSSKQLVQHLHAIEEHPWSEWSKARKPITERQLADVLRPFDIRSRTVRLPNNATPKGYRLDQFKDAWERYIPVPPSFADDGSATPPHPRNDAENTVFRSAADTEERSATPPHPRINVGTGAFDPPQPSNGAPRADHNACTPAPMAVCGGVAAHVAAHVAAQNACTPAPMAVCGGVADRSAEHGEGQQHTGLHAGDWCSLLSADGVQQNADPYVIASVDIGPDGQQYARFYATNTGWPLAQCERTDPPAPMPPPEDVEEF